MRGALAVQAVAIVDEAPRPKVLPNKKVMDIWRNAEAVCFDVDCELCGMEGLIRNTACVCARYPPWKKTGKRQWKRTKSIRHEHGEESLHGGCSTHHRTIGMVSRLKFFYCSGEMLKEGVTRSIALGSAVAEWWPAN